METVNQITNITNAAKEAWSTATQQLQGSMDRQTYAALLGNASLLAYGENTYTVGMKNAFTRDWAEKRLTETIEKILTALYDEPQMVRFVLDNEYSVQTSKDTVPEDSKTVLGTSAVSRPKSGRTSSRYTFENFVASSSNQLAYAACRAVAEIPSTSYNPLFIYSEVGLGKTHLLHAIEARLAESGRNVLYVTSEEFTNDFIHSIQHHEHMAFREKYRTADVLLIDDIQFIIGKESTQEEFFHTFNKLYDMEKQIVITSDRAPKAMSTLDERMRSRFEWGLTVDIQPPDLETRIAILQKKVNESHKEVGLDVLEQIAHQIPNNIRELEGALNRVLAVSDLCGRRMDKELVRVSLTDMTPAHRTVRTADIVNVVSEVFCVLPEKIMSRERTKDVALSRQVCMYLMREEGDMSLPQIGQELGGRDHTTIMHGCAKVERLLETDNRFRRLVMEARDRIYGSTVFA